jgi:hypothetical protein
MAHLSEDREIFDSDDGDLSLPRRSQPPPKQVVDLVLDDSDDGVGDNGGDVNRVNLLKNTRNGSISCEANSALVDRPLPDCRPALFSPTVLLAAACRIRSQQPTSHLAEKISSEECPFVVSIAPQTSTAFHYASSNLNR